MRIESGNDEGAGRGTAPKVRIHVIPPRPAAGSAVHREALQEPGGGPAYDDPANNKPQAR
jgi:hypothetical protein